MVTPAPLSFPLAPTLVLNESLRRGTTMPTSAGLRWRREGDGRFGSQVEEGKRFL